MFRGLSVVRFDFELLLMRLAPDTKAHFSKPLFHQPVCNQGNYSVVNHFLQLRAHVVMCSMWNVKVFYYIHKTVMNVYSICIFICRCADQYRQLLKEGKYFELRMFTPGKEVMVIFYPKHMQKAMNCFGIEAERQGFKMLKN